MNEIKIISYYFDCFKDRLIELNDEKYNKFLCEDIKIYKLLKFKTKIIFKKLDFDDKTIKALYLAGLKINSLNSDNFMKTIGYNERGIYYEFINGENIRNIIFSYDDFYDIFLDLINELEYSYNEIGFIHCDISPLCNIIIRNNKFVLIDYDSIVVDEIYQNIWLGNIDKQLQMMIINLLSGFYYIWKKEQKIKIFLEELAKSIFIDNYYGHINEDPDKYYDKLIKKFSFIKFKSLIKKLNTS